MAKNYRRLWKDVTSTSDEGKAIRILAEIVVDREGRTFISSLPRKDADLCIEILDHVSPNSYTHPSFVVSNRFPQGIAEYNLKTVEKNAFFTTLRRLAGTHGRLPKSMMITEDIEVSDKVSASGGFADIRTGKYMGRHLVAVKTMRVAEQDELSKIRKVRISIFLSATWDAVLSPLRQQFCKEVVLWNTLSHPNVLKLVGVRGDIDQGQFITVSEWMTHGNIMEYIKKHRVNRLALVCDFTSLVTPFTKIRQTVVWSSPGSEVPPRCQSYTRRPQGGQCPFVS